MKKILILVMSCNNEFFIAEEKAIKETWAKDIIDKKYENIDFLIYRGDNEKNIYEKKENLLLLNCEDDIQATFKKTYLTFKLINKLFEYDYIFRTNTSTYINVNLLNSFVQSLEDDSIIYGGELYSLIECRCPAPLDIFARGSSVLYSKKIVDIITTNGIGYKYLELSDDWCIGNIVNSYHISNKENYLNYIKSYPHAWYKCIEQDYDNGNTICTYGNTNKDFSFLNKFISIQVKNYINRDNEIKSFYELDEVFKNNTCDNENIIKYINKYSQNPNIFIGENLKYLSFNTWKKVYKVNLYEYEFKTRKYSVDKIDYLKRNKLI